MVNILYYFWFLSYVIDPYRAGDTNRPISSLPVAQPDPSPGLDPDRLRNLPSDIAYENEIDLIGQPVDCAICKLKIKKNERINRLDCRHVYHAECLGQWFLINIICPLCRRKVGR